MELAANPQLLFLDEPTSGLDSAGARKVMKYVKKLSRQGRTIVYATHLISSLLTLFPFPSPLNDGISCTIHQPSSEIFGMFDQLLLLTQHGEAVYFGDIGENGDSLLEYTAQYGYRMERERNPADFALEFATATNRLGDAALAASMNPTKEANNEEHDAQPRATAEATESSGEHKGETNDDSANLSLSPDTPQHKRPATPLSPLSAAPESPYIEASSSLQRGREIEEQGMEDGDYVETVDELVEGYYQSELYSGAMEEMDHIQPDEFKAFSYPGTFSSSSSLSSLPLLSRLFCFVLF